MEEKSNVSRFTVSLSTEGNNALNAIMTLTNRNPNREKSNVIDEAIQFYFSYLSGQLNMDYVCGIYGRQVEALVQRATDRISSQLFKQAVETNMLTRIVAFEYELSKDEYDKMRSKAVAAVVHLPRPSRKVIGVVCFLRISSRFISASFSERRACSLSNSIFASEMDSVNVFS